MAMYFLSANGTKLGYISHEDQMTLSNPKIKAGSTNAETYLWLAEQFNIYRGLSSGGTSVLVGANRQEQINSTVGYSSSFAELMNNYRIEQGLHELEYDNSLQDLADERAREQAISFGHTRPDGSSVMEMGYAEIASKRNTPISTLNGFKNSPSHNAIMSSEHYSTYTVGFYDDLSGGHYWVVIFGR